MTKQNLYGIEILELRPKQQEGARPEIEGQRPRHTVEQVQRRSSGSNVGRMEGRPEWWSMVGGRRTLWMREKGTAYSSIP